MIEIVIYLIVLGDLDRDLSHLSGVLTGAEDFQRSVWPERMTIGDSNETKKTREQYEYSSTAVQDT